MTLRARAVEFFVEPRAAAPPAEAPRQAFLAPVPAARRDRPPRGRRPRPATRLPLRAAVLGASSEAVPLGALLANALRSAAGVPAAVLAVWAPGRAAPRGAPVPPALRAAPASPAAARLAARLTARGIPATARGRLALLALDEHPVAATVAARRAAGALEMPLVAVLAGPRCDVVESLLTEQDLVVVACAEPDGPLARLAVAGCTAAALACPPPPPGPARWLARSGLAGARSLPAELRSLVTELADLPEPEPVEVAW